MRRGDPCEPKTRRRPTPLAIACHGALAAWALTSPAATQAGSFTWRRREGRGRCGSVGSAGAQPGPTRR